MSLTKHERSPRSLATAVHAHRAGLAVSAGCAVIGAACSLAPYLAVYAVTVALFVEDAPERIPGILLWTTAALLARAATNAIATHVGHTTAYRTLKSLRLAIADKLRRLPLGQVQARSSGEMKKILHDDVEQLEEALAHGIPDGAAAAAVPVATTVILFAVDWRLALLAMLALLLLVLISAIGMALAQRNNHALAEHSLVLNRAVMSYLQGIKVIRSYMRADSGYNRARAAVLRSSELQDVAASGPLRWLVAAMSAATALAVALLVPGAGLAYVGGDVHIATVVLFLLLGLAYLSPIVGLVGTLAAIMARIQLSAAAVQELLAEHELPEPVDSRVPDRFDVEFDNVSFGYREDQVTLDGVSLRVPQGSSLALVGATGSGKSTIARLLARFYDTRSGSVRIGGVDVRDIPSAQLAQLVAFVQQDEYVFAASLLENIRIARPDATDDEVEWAARQAQLTDVADDLIGGWHTELSAGGAELSGGQRQRIAVARALLKDAPVIVLDEATASLDAATERRTLDAFADLTRDRTVIIIAHRLATITSSNQIAFVAEGRLEVQGTHEQLLQHLPYRDLWQAYVRSAGWRLEPGPAAVGFTPAAADHHRRTGTRTAGTVDGADDRIERPGVGAMGFFQQWRTLYGRSWRPLVRQGLVRLILESLVRGAPLLAVLVIVLAAIGALPGRPLDTGLVALVTGLLALALLARVAASAWANALVWRLAARSKSDLQLSVLDRLRRVPLGFIQRVDRGRLGALVTSDIPMVDFQNIPQQVLGAMVQPLYALVVLVIVDWRLALAALAGVPLFWALTVWSDRIYHRVFADLHQARQEATAAMLEQASGAAVLRGNPQSSIARRYESAMDRLASASIAMSVRATPATTLGSVAVESGQVMLVAVGAALFTSGSVSAATLLVFLMLSLTIYQPIQELNALAGYRRNQQQIAAKVGQVWDAPTLSEPEPPVAPDGFAVELHSVSFGYTDTETTLLDVSLRAEAGQVTALVGASGSGKSTIASLVSRLWDVDAGAVTIGGVDVRNVGSTGVLQAVTTVFQDTYLFDDTVRFNLTLGRPLADDEEIWAALRAAQCDDVVAALPDGLDTVLADGGWDLSGGQRQRLAITRALLKDSPILILDEAVAAVDPGTEDRIQAGLARLAAGRTVIVVAHRIATIQRVPHIVVVDRGTIAGSGTHDHLLRSCGTYQALAAAQVAGSTGALTDTVTKGH